MVVPPNCLLNSLAKLTRRSLITSAVLLPTLAHAQVALAQRLVQAILTQIARFGRGPMLLNSYLIRTSTHTNGFNLTQANAAYVYDNALAGLLLFNAGYRQEALYIAQALEMAQAHDRNFHDGRLRNAYAAGLMSSPAKLPGFWNQKTNQWDEDPYQVGSDTGPIAWAMLLWAKLGMDAPANKAGDFLNTTLRAPLGYYGGFYGYDQSQQKLTWESTEQNLDLAVAFKKLGRMADAAHAAGFVEAAYEPKEKLFKTGLTPEGHPGAMLAADAGIWPYLAGLGSAESAEHAIARLRHGEGIGFSDASHGIWLEGTAFAALALNKIRSPLAASFMDTIAENVSRQGYVYATVSPTLTTGLKVGPSLDKTTPPQDFNYYRYPALSTTSWAGMAALKINPLD